MHADGDIPEPWPVRAPLTRRDTLRWFRDSAAATFNPF
jgi:hypothetical protein